MISYPVTPWSSETAPLHYKSFLHVILYHLFLQTSELYTDWSPSRHRSEMEIEIAVPVYKNVWPGQSWIVHSKAAFNINYWLPAEADASTASIPFSYKSSNSSMSGSMYMCMSFTFFFPTHDEPENRHVTPLHTRQILILCKLTKYTPITAEIHGLPKSISPPSLVQLAAAPLKCF
jgi:hypothetical protein